MIPELHTALLSDALPENLDIAQQIVDAIGEEPCIVGCDRTGPNGLCKECKATFIAAYPDRNIYEIEAFGVDAESRFTTDQIADLIFGKVETRAVPALVTPEGFPLTAEGEFDVQAMTPEKLGEFWAFMDAKQRTANEVFGGYKTAASTRLDSLIAERRKVNPNARAVPHKSLTIQVNDVFTQYQFNKELLADVAQALPDDEFEKIAKYVAEVIPDPIPAHWEIKTTASTTVKSLIERYDGTPVADLLRKFMWRDKTGEKLQIEYRKGAVQNVTPTLDKAS